MPSVIAESALMSCLILSSNMLMQPLMEAGLDSIGAVELRNDISTKFGIELPATATFDYPSVDALAGFLVQQTTPIFGQQHFLQALAYTAHPTAQPAVNHRQIAAQLAATVSELLGFPVPTDQVNKLIFCIASNLIFVFHAFHTCNKREEKYENSSERRMH